jgi:hypothetical protein
VTRLILVVSLVLSATTAFAQPDDWSDRPRRGAEIRRNQPWRDWDNWPSRHDQDGVHLRILRDYHLESGATASEPVVVVGGSATIDGHVTDDVVVIGGELTLGPTAVVDGDVFTAGKEPRIDPAAKVRGKIDRAVFSIPGVDVGWRSVNIPRGWWSFASLGAMVMRLGMVLTISLLLTLIAPGWIRSMAGRASSAGSAGFLGAMAEVLFVPALLAVAIALVISVIGIPLLAAIPFLIAGGAMLWIGGFAAVAVSLGARLRGSRGVESSVPMLDLLTGFLAITGVTIIAHFAALTPSLGGFGWVLQTAGLVIEYVAWTIGLGAALSTFVAGRRRVPPPVPAPA